MSSPEPQRLPHRRAISSPRHQTRLPHSDILMSRTPKTCHMPPSSDIPSSPSRPKAASRLMHSVKRTLSPASATKKSHTQYTKSAMHSTLAETSSPVPQPRQQFRDPDPTSSRPTIEQIAMGLHISRTPHLRPLSASPYAFSQRNSASHSAHLYEAHPHHRTTPISLPPPPTRSSLKKPSATVTSSSSSPAVSPPFSSASGSTTTVTSMAPSSSHSPRSFAAIKFRMARFLPHSRSAASSPSLMSSPPTSPRDSTDLQPKKAVRFTAEEAGDGD